MKVRDTRAGTLTAFTSFFLGLLALFSAIDAVTVPQRLWYGVICAIFMFWRFRLGKTGVFDTEDGLVVRRMRRPTVMVLATAAPTVDFEKRLAGHRLVIQTNDGHRIATDFLFARPALEPRLELPINLVASASSNSTS